MYMVEGRQEAVQGAWGYQLRFLTNNVFTICSKSRGQTIIVKLWIVHKARTELSLLFHSSLFLQLIHTQSHYCGVFLVAFSSIMSENAHQLTDSRPSKGGSGLFQLAPNDSTWSWIRRLIKALAFTIFDSPYNIQYLIFFTGKSFLTLIKSDWKH